MPRPERRKRSRLNLTLTPAAREVLDELAQREPSRSLSEIVSRALALYGTAIEARGDGGALQLRRADGETVQLVFPW